MSDCIYICKLALRCHIGVPDAERAAAQHLQVSLALYPHQAFRRLGDDIARTVDYAAVCSSVQAVAAARPRKLVETLAEDLCEHLLSSYPLATVELELRKFILPETDYVAIRMRREQGDFA